MIEITEKGIVQDLSETLHIDMNRLRELAIADREGRVVVLPVAVGGLAETTAGKVIVNNWDVVARVTLCEPLNDGKYWGDKYDDFDISDIADARTTDPASWHEIEPVSEAAAALAEKERGHNAWNEMR